MVSLNVSKADLDLINKVADRAVGLYRSMGIEHPKLNLFMDLCAVQANGCPLRLADLLAADDGNFAHDIAGIGRHLDRETGRLTGFFVPRFAAPRAEG